MWRFACHFSWLVTPPETCRELLWWQRSTCCTCVYLYVFFGWGQIYRNPSDCYLRRWIAEWLMIWILIQLPQLLGESLETMGARSVRHEQCPKSLVVDGDGGINREFSLVYAFLLTTWTGFWVLREFWDSPKLIPKPSTEQRALWWRDCAANSAEKRNPWGKCVDPKNYIIFNYIYTCIVLLFLLQYTKMHFILHIVL